MRKHFIVLLLSAAVLSACEEPKKEKPLDKFSWLEGTWEGMTEQNNTREQWTKVNDQLMTGDGVVLAGTDTVFKEHLQLVSIDSSIYYVVFIPGLPDSTSFKLTKYENGEAVFENPEHDDPQKIVYRKAGEDSLYAYVEGATPQGIKRIEYPYKRTSPPPGEKNTKKE